MEETTQERPLVTFAVFAYNQEEYIREAIEGAFSQTYEPLEIILSDDCSTDGTFEIMQQMAMEYSGPHQVIVRTTESNRGTFNHVLEVFGAMSGQLMVLAAGDDVSYKERCSIIVDEWRVSGAKVIFSKYEKISDSGETLGIEESSGDREIMSWFPPETQQEFNHGATTAYDHSIFYGLDFSDSPIFSEDAIFYFLSMVNGYKIHKIQRPLVKYRQSSGSISNNKGGEKVSVASVESFEKKIAWMACSYEALCDYVLKLLCGDPASSELRDRVRKTKRFAMIRRQWLNNNFFERFRLFLICRSWREFRFLVPRVFGIKAFSIVKSWRAGMGDKDKA